MSQVYLSRITCVDEGHKWRNSAVCPSSHRNFYDEISSASHCQSHRGIVYHFFVLHLHSLSTYDIVITTYSLLAKEIPTKKQEELVPGTNLSEEVRLGTAREGEVEPHLLSLSLVTASETAEVPSCEVRRVLAGPPVETKRSLSHLFYSRPPPQW